MFNEKRLNKFIELKKERNCIWEIDYNQDIMPPKKFKFTFLEHIWTSNQSSDITFSTGFINGKEMCNSTIFLNPIPVIRKAEPFWVLYWTTESAAESQSLSANSFNPHNSHHNRLQLYPTDQTNTIFYLSTCG